MYKGDAEKVIYILLEADGGCPECASSLVDYFKSNWPEYSELAENLYAARYKISRLFPREAISEDT